MSKFAAIIVTAAPEGLPNDGAALTRIDGRESVLRAMEMFTNREGIVQTLLVINAAEAEEIKRKIGSHLMFMGIKLVQGGATWFEQLADAQKRLSDDATHVIVHDGARPAVPYTDLDTLSDKAPKHPAVGLALPVSGQVLRFDTIPGPAEQTTQKIAQLLSPIVYDRATFKHVCEQKKQPNPLHLIEGSPLNVRCGTSEASLVKAMIGLLPKPKMKAPSSPFEEAQW
jgi:2-C-methyl-D-erythritol 4-phosphate cytidylyltransferase